jgi:hypothetical protein
MGREQKERQREIEIDIKIISRQNVFKILERKRKKNIIQKCV